MEYFRIEVCQVCHYEDEYRFNHAHMIGETRHQTSKEAPNDAWWKRGVNIKLELTNIQLLTYSEIRYNKLTHIRTAFVKNK